ncbi:esterase-like activity of phytase family protein [Psychrobacter sp. CAL346-MNA-CIBAN-0220]|uniref:esterase-like activity of phytase family protein n=1 Tax=Psychrobacter sp. CAL346-MNA-CIBAN-0220 TaxID=3140457 RepID=UPI0033309FCF
MLKTNKKQTIVNISEFIQGSLLPYSVMNNSVINNQFINAAYPEKKLEIRNGGFGSDAAAHPTNTNQFYALTDRGPNADFDGSAGKGKQFLTPDYTPRIGLFELQADGKIKKVKEILLKDANGNPISGLPNPKALGGTNEIPYDVSGKLMTVNPDLPFNDLTNPIKNDINGLDPEGLAALTDGSFWISDEYGPHLVHYNADGVEIARINPFSSDKRNTVIIDGNPVLLPTEFANRRPNRGMESLTITPDQTTLVGVMESSMDNPDKSGRLSSLTRMVTINLVTGQISQYLYRLNKAQYVISGVVALSSHVFYLIEHDREFLLQVASAQKHIYKVDITTATDLEKVTSENSELYLDNYSVEQNKNLGLMIDGQTLEQFIVATDSNWQTFEKMNIKAADKILVADVIAALNYPHDKLEGLWLREDGSLGLLNDDDFCITDSTMTNSAMTDANYTVEQKYLDKEKTIEDANRLYIVMPSE